MITLLALSLICFAVVAVVSLVGGIVLSILGLPLMLLFSLLPWLLRAAGVVLLIKGLLDQPVTWENFMPAVVAFLLAWLLRWF